MGVLLERPKMSARCSCPRHWSRSQFLTEITTTGPLGHSGTPEAALAVEETLRILKNSRSQKRRGAVREALEMSISHAIAGSVLTEDRVPGGIVHWITLVTIATTGARLGFDVFVEFSVPEKLRRARQEIWKDPKNVTARNHFQAEPAFGDLLGCHLFLLARFSPGSLESACAEAAAMLADTPFKTRTDARRRLAHYTALLDSPALFDRATSYHGLLYAQCCRPSG